MSNAEVTAYLAGAQLARDHRAELEAGAMVVYEPEDGLSAEQAAALQSLGPQMFAEWALRGAVEALRD